MIFVTFYLVFLNDNSSVLIRTAVVDCNWILFDRNVKLKTLQLFQHSADKSIGVCT